MATLSQKRVRGILLILALCALVDFLVAGWRDAPEPQPPPSAVIDSDVIATEQLLDTHSSLAPEASPVTHTATSSAQVPRPDIQLIGTLIAPPKTRSAIIARADGEFVVSPGASIDGHWTLHQIFPGKIVIRSAERELILRIRGQVPAMGHLRDAPIEADPHDPGASHEEKMNRYYANQTPEAVAFPEGLNTRGIEKVSGQTFSVDVKALLDQLLATPLRRQFDYEMEEGGLRLVEIVPGGVVDHFGFVPGDIIAKIDDTPITRVEDLQWLMQPNGNRVAVQFMREAEAMTHTYLLQ